MSLGAFSVLGALTEWCRLLLMANIVIKEHLCATIRAKGISERLAK
jgi:hypothetical protein